MDSEPRFAEKRKAIRDKKERFFERKVGQEVVVAVVESVSGAAPEGPSVGRKSYGRESQAPVGDTRLGISRQVSVRGGKNPFCAPFTDLDPSTPLGRAFEARSTGFPEETASGYLVRAPDGVCGAEVQ